MAEKPTIDPISTRPGVIAARCTSDRLRATAAGTPCGRVSGTPRPSTAAASAAAPATSQTASKRSSPSTSSPSGGPTARPPQVAREYRLTASPRRPGGARSLIIVAVATNTSASPTPLTSRSATRAGMEAATVYSTRLVPRISPPATISGRRPTRSPKRPATGCRRSAVRLAAATARPTPTLPASSGPVAYNGKTGIRIPIPSSAPKVARHARTNGRVRSLSPTTPILPVGRSRGRLDAREVVRAGCIRPYEPGPMRRFLPARFAS